MSLALWSGWTLLSGHPFDPYPFIVLNLLPSLPAAMQARIFLMSQNRQAKLERHRASSDDEVNLRAERGIMELRAKRDRPAERLP